MHRNTGLPIERHWGGKVWDRELVRRHPVFHISAHIVLCDDPPMSVDRLVGHIARLGKRQWIASPKRGENYGFFPTPAEAADLLLDIVHRLDIDVIDRLPHGVRW